GGSAGRGEIEQADNTGGRKTALSDSAATRQAFDLPALDGEAGRRAFMARKIRYGIIGAGHAAQVLHLPQLCRDPRVEVVWCADVRPEVAARTAAQFGVPHAGSEYERLLDERPVDAVSLCIPHHAHFEAAMAAIR